MPDKLLYNLSIPESAELSQSTTQARQLLAQGVLGAGPAAVESISSEAGEKLLSARVKGRYARLTAQEFEELFSAGNIEVVPLFQRGPQTTADDRYVALENVDVEPAHPTEDRVQAIDGAVRPIGTRQTHRRAVRTTVSDEQNPFGSGSTAELGIPRRARGGARPFDPQWYNDSDGSLVDATVQRTVEGEHDEIDIYDATEPSFSDPVLVYDVPYRHEWPVDARVWDDYNRTKYDTESTSDGATVGSATVGSATVGKPPAKAVQWARVFVVNHDFRGRPVLENDRLRIVLDEPEQKIRAYRWNTDDNHYDIVQLGQSSWRLFDISLTWIGLARIDGQLEFQDVDNPTSKHNLNFTLRRGYDDVLWLVPPNGSSPPQGLVDRLDPIAHDSQKDPGAVGDVIERKGELNR